MKVNNIFIVVALSTLLSACAAGLNLDAPIGESLLLAHATATLNIPAQTPTPTPSITATRLVTPTVDYSELIGQAELQTKQEQLDLQRKMGTATLLAVTAEYVRGSQTALQDYMNSTATATTAQGNRRGTSTAAVAQTLIAQAIGTESARQTATVQAPITQRLQAEADFEPLRQIIIVVGLVATILLILWLAAHAGYQWVMFLYAKRLALMGEMTATVQPEQVNARLDRRDPPGWGSVDITTVPIGRTVLCQVAELMVGGARYTQAQMCGSGRPLVKDGNFDTFGEWMVKWGIAVKFDDGRYSIIHPEFFGQVLSRLA